MLFEKQILNAYKKKLFSRCDDTGCVFYYSASDFAGLKQEPYAFSAKAGHRMQGYFYFYGEPNADRIVVFDHGMGGGHRSYMKEIEMLARHGYRVFSYDHTGCMESEGESTHGFSQSLSDLDDCLTALKSDARFQGASYSVVGHSWGGFATLNIPALHPDVTHIVAMSGFLSVEAILKQNFSGLMGGYYQSIYALEEQENPAFVGYDARKTFSRMRTKAFVLYSADDKIVRAIDHYAPLRRACEGLSNVHFMLVNHKGHNPNFTTDAVRYKDAFFADLTKRIKKKALADDDARRAFVKSYDWDRMTAQDEEVWSKIFRVLDSAQNEAFVRGRKRK